MAEADMERSIAWDCREHRIGSMNEPVVSKTSRSGERKSSPGGLLLRFLMSVALAYLIVALTACFFQRRLIYFPLSGPVELPAHPRYAGLTEVALRSSDGVNL